MEKDKKIHQMNEMDHAIQEFHDACEAVKARKKAAYDALESLNDKRVRNRGELNVMKLSEDRPFDVEEARTAANETGDPVETKHMMALSRGLNTSVFREAEFCAATRKVINAVIHEASAEDARLEEDVNTAEAMMQRETERLSAEVAAAQGRLSEHRKKIMQEIIKPALDADTYLLVDNPFQANWGQIGGRNLGICVGSQYPAKVQLQSLWNATINEGRSPQNCPPSLISYE